MPQKTIVLLNEFSPAKRGKKPVEQVKEVILEVIRRERGVEYSNLQDLLIKIERCAVPMWILTDALNLLFDEGRLRVYFSSDGRNGLVGPSVRLYARNRQCIK